MTKQEITFWGSIVLLGVAALTTFASFTLVPEGARGVIVRAGAVKGIAQPGINFKVPFLDKIVRVSTQTQSIVYEDLEAYSRDQQLAGLSVSVTYRLAADQVDIIYVQYGGESGLRARLLDRRVNELVKTVFGQFTASSAIQERSRLNLELSSAIQAVVDGPIIIESVQIEDVSFSRTYEQSIEARMMAEVEVQKVAQELEQQKIQAEITVTQAQAQADSELARATAEAQAIRLRGEAEAESIRLRGEALAAFPELVELISAERWDGMLPTTFVPGSAVPFVSIP